MDVERLIYRSHDAQLSKPLQHIRIDTTQPLFLESLLPAARLDCLLNMLPHKSDEVDLMHRIRVK
jgi:hypothetical protein